MLVGVSCLQLFSLFGIIFTSWKLFMILWASESLPTALIAVLFGVLQVLYFIGFVFFALESLISIWVLEVRLLPISSSIPFKLFLVLFSAHYQLVYKLLIWQMRMIFILNFKKTAVPHSSSEQTNFYYWMLFLIFYCKFLTRLLHLISFCCAITNWTTRKKTCGSGFLTSIRFLLQRVYMYFRGHRWRPAKRW